MKRHTAPERRRPARAPKDARRPSARRVQPLIGALCCLCYWIGIAGGCPGAASVGAGAAAVVPAVATVPVAVSVAAVVVVAGAGQADHGGRAVLVRRGHDDRRLHAVAELARVTGRDAVREVLVVPVL